MFQYKYYEGLYVFFFVLKAIVKARFFFCLLPHWRDFPWIPIASQNKAIEDLSKIIHTTEWFHCYFWTSDTKCKMFPHFLYWSQWALGQIDKVDLLSRVIEHLEKCGALFHALPEIESSLRSKISCEETIYIAQSLGLSV